MCKIPLFNNKFHCPLVCASMKTTQIVNENLKFSFLQKHWTHLSPLVPWQMETGYIN